MPYYSAMDTRTAAYYEKMGDEAARRYEETESPLKDLPSRLYPEGTLALDIGCGSGRDAAFLNSRGCKTVGIDPSRPLLLAAGRLHPEIAGNLYPGFLPDGLEGAAEHKPYDLILLSAVIMHIPDDDLAPSIEALRNLAHSASRLIISHCPRREGLDREQRDGKGRLFRLRSSALIEALCSRYGFALKERLIQQDSLGRSSLQWEVLIFTAE
jgi:SAM-dependent methyltransferase